MSSLFINFFIFLKKKFEASKTANFDRNMPHFDTIQASVKYNITKNSNIFSLDLIKK